MIATIKGRNNPLHHCRICTEYLVSSTPPRLGDDSIATCTHPLSASDFLRRVPVKSESPTSYLTANARFDIWCDSNPNNWYAGAASGRCFPGVHLREVKASQQPLNRVVYHTRSKEQHVHARKLITRIKHEKPESIDMALRECHQQAL